jgi:hypothetical protein
MPFVLLFFVIISVAMHKYLVKANKKNTAKFVPVFMLVTFIKIMVCLIFMTIYALIFREHAVQFILTFLILYMIFTAFEVTSILPFVKRAKE